MGIFGTIFGGSLGFIVGGPLGAILGGALGSMGSNIAGGAPAGRVFPGQVSGAYSAHNQQVVFAIALTSLAAKVAKADGRVTEDEVQAFDDFLRHSMRMSEQDRRFAAKVFNEARDNSTPASEFAHQVCQVFRGQPDRLRDIITILLMIALADGHFHPDEETLIREIARDMGLDDGDYESCRATFFAATGKPDTSPYEILGVPHTASDDEVRSAHRRLVRDYHPDVIQSKGLPADFMKFATEKSMAINEAWAAVRKERGM
jgi:DnaJ like chaperone protein